MIETISAELSTPDLSRRFSGLERLYGVSGFAQIQRAHVAVIGIGGVGSWAVEALARSGVGRITMIDMDHIAESNLNRQVHALNDTIGQAKVLAMRDRISQINPACQVTCIEEFVTIDNWPQLLRTPVNAVIDACDQLKAKLALAVWSKGREQRQTVFVTVGAAGGKRFAHKVEIDDLSVVTHDPLLAQLRYRMRKNHNAAKDGRKIGLVCVFSRESVLSPNASCASAENDGTLNCHGYGSLVSVTSTFGQCAAGYALDRIATK